jgi:hypothetical protein
MSESDFPATSRFAVPLEALEREARVPLDDQITEGADTPGRDSGWAWDEERRQAQLAGGA